jgi:DNA-binding NarL/FixJ family response regulator
VTTTASIESMTFSPTAVGVVEDRAVVRAGLSQLISTLPAVDVMWMTSGVRDATALLALARVDTVFVGLDLIGTGAEAVVARLRSIEPTVHLVGIAGRSAGVGLAGLDQIIDVSASEREVSGSIRRAGTRPRMTAPIQPAPSPGASTLTPRELAILQRLSNAPSNRELARDLKIAEATVKRHLGSIFAKLGVQSRGQAVVSGRRAGLLY